MEEKIIKGPITFELTEEEIQAIKNGAKTIAPIRIKSESGAFAIRNHSFSRDVVKLYKKE